MSALLVLATLLLADMGTLTGKVVKVTDGDTITVLVEKQEITIRLNTIDAPERGQDFGQKSKEALADLVFRKEVRIETHGKDRYGRTIGDVYVGSIFVNEKMVEDGWAWNYLKYSKSQRLADLERQLVPPRGACGPVNRLSLLGSIGPKRPERRGRSGCGRRDEAFVLKYRRQQNTTR